MFVTANKSLQHFYKGDGSSKNAIIIKNRKRITVTVHIRDTWTYRPHFTPEDVLGIIAESSNI